MAVEDFDHSNPEVMLSFYRRLYPFKSVFKWLNQEHTPTRLFTNREIAYSLPGDIYIRYNSFLDAEDFKNQTLKYNPERFEIGPVYSARVRGPVLPSVRI
jgi:DNA primase small subunit